MCILDKILSLHINVILFAHFLLLNNLDRTFEELRFCLLLPYYSW